MNILVILGHQEKGSFNHAIADTAVKRAKGFTFDRKVKREGALILRPLSPDQKAG